MITIPATEDLKDIWFYIDKCSEPVRNLCYEKKDFIETASSRNHPGEQSKPGGIKLHLLQVMKMALALNQEFDEIEVMETAILHDIVPGYKRVPLKEYQRIAIEA